MVSANDRSSWCVRVLRGAMACGVVASAWCLVGCGVFDNAPRGAKSLSEVFAPSVSPAEAADMATDPYSPERRFQGTSLLAASDFGGGPVYIELYLHTIEDADPGVRAAGARALGRHGEPEHVPLLVDLLKDTDRLVRFEAARSLQRLHNPVAVPALLDHLQLDREPDTDVRVASAGALGQYPESRVLQGLIGALGDPRLAVNYAVRGSLATLTGQDFGVDRSAWMQWIGQASDPFAAGRTYVYPGFERAKKPYEYLPFTPNPPRETASAPVGLDPSPKD